MFQICTFLFLMMIPQSVFACAACSFADDGTQGAYLFTAGVLTLAPLMMFAGVVWWIRKKLKSNEEGDHES